MNKKYIFIIIASFPILTILYKYIFNRYAPQSKQQNPKPTLNWKGVTTLKGKFKPQKRFETGEEETSGDIEFNFSASKKILFYTRLWASPHFHFGFGNEPFHVHNCPETNCFTTSNKSLLGSINNFDAIIFHMRDFRTRPNNFKIPNQSGRKPNQRYIMYLCENPVYDYYNYEKLPEGFFNWTMTYRLDSDISQRHGWIEPHGTSPHEYRSYYHKMKVDHWLKKPDNWKPSEYLREMYAKKTQEVVWLVSNCGGYSARQGYFHKLRRYIPSSKLGKCGKKCDDNCYNTIEEKFKFYLAFENSICKDYLTEKFFRTLRQNMIPVVLTGSNLSEVAPPHSYIDVRDFESPKALAEYLKELGQNEEEYLSYFWWRDYFKVNMDISAGMCKLCSMLNLDLPHKSYHKIGDWWRTRKCLKSYKLPWLSDTDVRSDKNLTIARRK